MNASTQTPDDPSTTYRLMVSPYERVSSMMIAMVVLLGILVSIIVIILLTRNVYSKQVAVPVELIELGTGSSGLAGGMELAGPTDQDLGVEAEFPEPAIENTLATVADAVGQQLSMLDSPALTTELASGQGGGARGDGRVPGNGTGNGSGTGRNWEVHFGEGSTLKVYASQLDHFRIELGVLEPDNRVLYVSGLSQADPVVRVGTAGEEKRNYLTWRAGDLRKADAELLAKAGIDAGNQIILKFLPDEVVATLATLERDYAGRPASKVRRTVFGVRPGGGRFEFYVISQLAR